MKRLIRDEKGYILIAALLVLVVVGLISGPVLSYMVSGLRAGHVFETGAAELYAADAGVADAVWRIPSSGLCLGNPSTNYTITDINGKSVDVTITYVNNTTETVTYRVESTATSNGSGTRIDAYVIGTSIYGDFSGITNNVITSQGEIDLAPGTEVNPSTGNHSPVPDYGGAWPTAEELAAWYFEDVEDEEPYGSDTVDLGGVDQELGPFYRDGELEIVNTSNTPANLTLAGTIYISGDTLIGTTGKDFTLDLNGYTIFVASNSSDPQKALWMGGKCTLVGEGAVIAVGDIYFEPNTEAGVTDPVFIMSVVGTSTVQPGGDFYGSIAGSVVVALQPGTSIDYPETGFGVINFPGCTAGRYIHSIASWEVSRL